MSSRRTRSTWRLLAALLAFGLVAGACSSGGDDEDAEPEPEEVAQELEEAGAPWPLTGLPIEGDPLQSLRPALIVKIDNSEEARPQVGLNAADIVYEERVEGITRFAAVFHSTSQAPVGPVRSARSSDIDIITPYNNPIFAWGGANNGVAAQIEGAEVVSRNIDSAAVEDKFRDDERAAPHNLFITSTDDLWADPGDARSAPAQLQYRAPDSPAGTGAAPTPGVNIQYQGGGVEVDYVYDQARQGWVRFQNGTPHVDSDGVAVAPANVAVLYTEYAASPADPRSPDAQTVGSGEATIFLGDGTVVQGTWSRDSAANPYTILDTAGQPILFTPGRTWVALPTAGTAGFLDPGTAQELLATAPPAPATTAPADPTATASTDTTLAP
jgi:hypothetical protein